MSDQILTIQMPQSLYQQLQRFSKLSRRPLEHVVLQILEDKIPALAESHRQTRETEKAAIEREHVAFEQMLPELLKHYEGRVVAIYNGQIVDVGDDEGEVWVQARQRLGDVPVYVQTVIDPPIVYDMPSVEVVTTDAEL
jgi:hypothetical protein